MTTTEATERDAWVFETMPDFMVEAIAKRQEEEEAAERRHMQRGEAAVERARWSRGGSSNASSVVFTLRLGHQDLAEVHRQAALRSLPPSAFARNLIRCGLKDEPQHLRPAAGDLCGHHLGASELEALAVRVRRAGGR